MAKSKDANVRDMLLDFGVQPFLTDIAIPFMFFIPGAIDPDSPSIIEIIKGIQRQLHKLGFKKVKVSGVLDQETDQALTRIAGPEWMQKAFIQIYGDIMRAKRDPDRAAHFMSMDGYFEYSGTPPGPLPSWRAGTPPGPMGMGATATDQGVTLTYGEGIKNKSIMIPIPKSSGVTYNAFKNLQKAINRGLYTVKGAKAIAEDGMIGSSTHAALLEVQKVLMSSFPGDTNSADMAANAISLTNALNAVLDSYKVPMNAKPSITKPPQVASTAGPLSTQQAKNAALRQPTKFGFFPFLLLAGGVAFLMTPKKKKRK